MEQNLPILTKKIWNMAKLAYFMLKKGMSMKKLLVNLNSMMKLRQQYNLTRLDGVSLRRREYEFNCRNTPLYRHYFTNKRSKNQQYYEDQFRFSMASPCFEDIDDMKSLEAIDTVLESIVLSNKDGHPTRELRVTDSPFPLRSVEDSDLRVDEDAEELIKRFYSQLIKEQTCC